jgi:hypothetical protein
MIFGALYGLSAFAVYLCAQLMAMRCFLPERWLSWNKCGLALALLILVVTPGFILPHLPSAVLRSGGWPFAAVWGSLTFLCLYVLYMPFYFVVMTSLSVETLVLLAAQKDGRLPLVALYERFSSEVFARDRFDTMVRNGVLIRTAAGYSVSPRARKLVAISLWLKSIWRLGEGG